MLLPDNDNDNDVVVVVVCAMLLPGWQTKGKVIVNINAATRDKFVSSATKVSTTVEGLIYIMVIIKLV